MAGRKQHFYIPTINGVADKMIINVDFPIGGITVNNQTNSVFSIYHGTQSLGVGSVQPDYKATEFTFLKAPLDKQARSVTLSWSGSTTQYDPTHIVIEEDVPDFEFHSNPPNGAAGSATNVYLQNPIPAGTNEIGAVKIDAGGTADIAMNGTPVTGQALDAGGSNILGWLSQIVKQLKSTLTATISGALPAGANTIGNVGINAGTNAIGNVGVTTLPSIPAGGNNIGTVNIGSNPNVQAMTATPSTTQLSLVASTVTALRVGASDLTNRKQLVIVNLDASNTIYLGGSGVTTANGFPLKPGQPITFDQNPSSTATLYAICANAVSVAVMEVA